ncbi:MAG: hypothetical protein LUF82_00160 [Clostridia bacterium]|nr:hypothetical protein [Clostridia bacterium]
MKKNFSFSSKMHLFIIISCIVVAIGLAVGLVCQFCADGFFNWGGDYTSYQSVTVNYYDNVMSTDDVKDICDDAFDAAGVSYYSNTYADTTNGSALEYRFSTSQDAEAIQSAVTSISSQVSANWFLGGAYYSSAESLVGGGETLMWVGIALAVAVVAQFLYFLIRYRLMMACAAFIADVHNLALYLALLAITRVQVGSSVFALGVFVVLLTMVSCAVLFDRMRKNFKTDEYKALPSFEQVDKSACESFSLITTMNVVVAAVIAIVMVFAAIGALSAYSLLMPCIAAILAVLVCEYGTMFFIPSVYSRFKLKADARAAQKEKNIRTGKSKKKSAPAEAKSKSAE